MSQLLDRFLSAPERPPATMALPEVYGFLFAVASAPELIAPSEWLQVIFDEQDANYKTEREANEVLAALMDIYNDLNDQVVNGNLTVPDILQVREPVLANFDEQAPLSLWARGFVHGHYWLSELWDDPMPSAAEEELGACLVFLSFFADQSAAEEIVQEGDDDMTLEAMAQVVIQNMATAMANYANMGRLLYEETLGEVSREPVVNTAKVGRNEPCPCGSGKKFKHCCAQ